jgi:4-hydroxymandelate oxidase
VSGPNFDRAGDCRARSAPYGSNCTRASGRSSKPFLNGRNGPDLSWRSSRVDGGTSTNWETLARLRRTDTRQCDDCHGRATRDYVARRPNFDGIDVSDPASVNIAHLTWDSIKRLRDNAKMKIALKGILTHEDAALAADNGIDAIIVSNHGGRVVDSGRATIEILPEIVEAVGGRIPVLVDSGFRRGTDIIKALAMAPKPYA